MRGNMSKTKLVPANNFLTTLAANVDNLRLSDKEFRDFIRRSLPIVNFKHTHVK